MPTVSCRPLVDSAFASGFYSAVHRMLRKERLEKVRANCWPLGLFRRRAASFAINDAFKAGIESFI